jgi:hypothetical protein
VNMKTLAAVVILTVVGVAAASSAAVERALVLVTGANSSLDALSPPEIRRLYLGAVVVKDGRQLEPLRNLSDETLQEVFLQRVVYMSERAYERQLLSKVFRLGGKRPEAFYDREELIRALRTDPNTVSYMWLDAAHRDSRVKVVTELWTGESD